MAQASRLCLSATLEHKRDACAMSGVVFGSWFMLSSWIIIPPANHIMLQAKSPLPINHFFEAIFMVLSN